jgi:uncharacterized protein YndB with AHSA1/START domain
MSDIKLEMPVKADPHKVFRACLNPEALETWFAEHASVSVEEGRYDFWGRYTPGAPDRDGGTHRISEFRQGQKLVYEWKLRGVETRVEYEILTENDGCVFRLSHTGLPELQPYQSSIGDFWTHVLEGLRNWLERGKPYDLMDYGSEPMGDVALTVNIAARPQDVFHSLTDAHQLDRWIAKKVRLDPRPGGEIDFGWGHGPVRILEIVPSRKLSYSWRWAEEPDTVTTWELEGSEGGTRLTVVQSGFAPDRKGEDYYIGWHKFIWRLKTMLEAGPDWERVKTVSEETEPAG